MPNSDPNPDPAANARFVLLRWLRRTPIRRAVLLVVVCVVTALLLMERGRGPVELYEVGEVASEDVRAPISFSFADTTVTSELQQESEADVAPVYDFDATLASRLQNRVALAFDSARRKLAEASIAGRGEKHDGYPEVSRDEIANDFLRALEFSVDATLVQTLLDSGFDPRVEALASDFIGVAMRRYVVADRSSLPNPPRPITVVRILSDSRQEITLEDYAQVVTPEDVRQEIALAALESDRTALPPDGVKAASAIARASVRPNFSANLLLTDQRRHEARAAVLPVVHQVKRGTTLFRAGDVLEQRHVDMLQSLASTRQRSGLAGVLLSLVAITTLLVTTVYLYGSSYVVRFARDTRNLEAMGFILLLVLALARAVMETSASLFGHAAGGPLPSSFWYIVPVAGGVMLTRILANGETALVFALVSSMLAGVMMDQDVFHALFFLLSGLAAAGGIVHTHERLHVLRAGAQTAVVNAAVVLIIDLVRIHLDPASGITAATVLWDVLFAVLGGVVSAVVVLGFVPFFELFGFVTDYKLLELSNLNHPLLRQLMLRAPGTYHHSVIVGSLAEAAAGAIGANPLQARVAAYFHDVGKAVKPHFFVENQRDIPNPHNRLPPRQSAAILINHVRDGAALAREHRLPKPIIENILMHHGTGVIFYFYDRACRQAADGEVVDPAEFRYPGPRPNTREAGILHLADKVEAASRTIDHPTPEAIREVIQNIANGVLNDGQFEECPLTLKDLYTIARSFEEVLLGIYHARIEYPEPRSAPPTEPPGRASNITLEFANPLRDPATPGRAFPGEPRTADPRSTPGADEEDPSDPLVDQSEEI